MMTTTTTLNPNRIYLAHDSFVCGSTRCAGSTAFHTGSTICGATLRAIDTQDVTEWATYDMGPLQCECGRLVATGLADSSGAALTREA